MSATTSVEVTTTREYIPGATYILPVDKEEVNRLELQHICIKVAYDGNLLLVPHDKEKSYNVLESGSGTGVWLSDVSLQLNPASVLHGIDLDGSRFPTKRPPNVSFSTGSVLSLPPNWTGRFDIVHQRLLMCGLKRDDWPKAINEVYRVLAPGGWAQLGEYGPWGYGPAMDVYGRIYSLLYKHNGLVLRAYAEMEDWMREAGFTNVKTVRGAYPLGEWEGNLGRDGAYNLWNHFKALKEQVMKAGGFGIIKNEAELDAAIDAVKREWDETKGTEAVFIYVIGQKPPN